MLEFWDTKDNVNGDHNDIHVKCFIAISALSSTLSVGSYMCFITSERVIDNYFMFKQPL